MSYYIELIQNPEFWKWVQQEFVKPENYNFRGTIFWGFIALSFPFILFSLCWFEHRRINKQRRERIAQGLPPDHWLDLYD